MAGISAAHLTKQGVAMMADDLRATARNTTLILQQRRRTFV